MFYPRKNKSWELEVCGWKYFHVSICITVSASQQIPGLSRTFNLNLQDQNHFRGLSRPGIFTKENPGLCRRVGTLSSSWFVQLHINPLVRSVYHQYSVHMLAEAQQQQPGLSGHFTGWSNVIPHQSLVATDQHCFNTPAKSYITRVRCRVFTWDEPLLLSQAKRFNNERAHR